MTVESAPPAASARFAFFGARLRLGVDRFELSFADGRPLLGLLLVAAVLLQVLFPLLFGPAGYVLAALIVVTCGFRTTLRVTRQSSWVRQSWYGLCWKSVELGLFPQLRCCESDPDTLMEQRIMVFAAIDHYGVAGRALVEWPDQSPCRDAEAAAWCRLAEQQIEALHAPEITRR